MQGTKIPDLKDVSQTAEEIAEQLRQGLSGNLQPLIALADQLLTHHEALAQTYLGLVSSARQALQCFAGASSSSSGTAASPVQKMTVQ